MKTQQLSDGQGSTKISNLPEALNDYAANHGFPDAVSYNSGTIETNTSASYPAYKIEIDRGRPNLLSFNNQALYGNHIVTGVSYKEFVYKVHHLDISIW